MKQRLSALLQQLSPLAYTVLRIVSGALFACHGAQKLFGVLGGKQAPLLSQMGMGGAIEFVTGILIALGVWTSEAAFLASGTMAVAYIQFHWRGQLGTGLFPVVNKGELAAVYCFLFLFIATQGSKLGLRGGSSRAR